MSKTKSLLSFALAATMLFSTVFVGANAEDATPKTGTLDIGTATVEVGEPTATVDFTLTFDEAVKSPHSLCTIVSDYELTKLAVKSVDGTVVADDENLAEGDDDLVSSATVKISNNGLNLAAKKVIFESGVDSNAPVVTTIVFTATFDTSAAVAGTSVVSAAIDATNYDENTFALTVNAGEIVVEAKHEAVTDWSYDADNHWHACVVDGCTETYDVAAHEWGEGVETKPATETETGVMTYTCGVCPATKTEDIPVVEPSEPVDGVVDITWNPQIDAYIKLSNIVSLKDYSYQITYRLSDDYNNSLSNCTDKKMFLMVDNTNIDIELPNFVRGTYLSLKQLSVARLNSDLTMRMRIEYVDVNGVKHIDTSEATCTVNFVDRLTELYEAGSYTDANQLSVVEKFIAFNTKWNSATNYSNIKIPSVSANDFGADEVAWNSDHAGYSSHQYITFSNFGIRTTYRLSDSIYNELSAGTELDGKLIIKSPSMSTAVEVPFASLKRGTYVNFSQVSLTKMMEAITWQISYNYVDADGVAQSYISNSFDINAYETLSASSDELAVAFVEYANAWDAAY